MRVEVDPELEITEIVTRVSRQEGPALLFEKVKGSPFPLAINVFGSASRIEAALGCPPAELGEKLVAMAQAVQPPSFLKLWKSRRMVKRLTSMRTSRAFFAPVHQVSEEPALDELPILKCWPNDGGRFITFGLVMTHSPSTGARNVGLYRLQQHSSRTTGMHWQIQKGGGFHFAEAEKRGQPLPVSVVIGSDPYLAMAAVAPLPEGLDEVAFSGFLRQSPLRMTPAKTIPMQVPAHAEFVLEGVVPLQEKQMEGPFGDHFGHYSQAAPFPVFHVGRITRKNKPIFLATVVGKPPQEDRYLGDAMQEVLGPLIRMVRPEVKDLWAYYEAGFHNLLVVSVAQRYEKEAMKTALGLLGEGQLSLTKCLVLVDAQVNPRDFHAVLQAIDQNFDPSEDALILSGVPLDTLDFTSTTMNLGSKLVMNATRQHKSRPARKAAMSGASYQWLKEHDSRILGWRLWDETLLVVQVKQEGRKILEHLVHASALQGVKMIAVVSPDIDLEDRVSTLWGLFTRFDAARDVIFTETKIVGPTVRYGGRLGIDATWKSGYPDPLEMTDEIREKVNARWNDYGL